MSIQDYYTETAGIVTVTKPVWPSTGAETQSSSTIVCAINPNTGFETFAGGRNDVFADYKMFCSDTVTLTEQNRVLWAGQYFNVVFVKDTFNRRHHKLSFLKKDVR